MPDLLATIGLPSPAAWSRGERGIAKYEKLRRSLASAIEENRLPAGSRLPPELQLAEQTGLSLGTVQRALRELVAEGYVVRRQGRGTFVADRRRRMEEPLHCRFVDPADEKQLPVYTELLGRRRVCGPGAWLTALGSDPEGILRLDRRIDIDRRFAVGSRLFVRASRFGRLGTLPTRRVNGRNIKKLLHEEFGVTVTRIEQKMRVATLPSEVAPWIDRVAGELVMDIRAVARDAEDRPIYYQELFVPPTEEAILIDFDVAI